MDDNQKEKLLDLLDLIVDQRPDEYGILADRLKALKNAMFHMCDTCDINYRCGYKGDLAGNGSAACWVERELPD